MIGAQRYTPEHYEMITQWWVNHKIVPPEKAMYPDTGFVVENVSAAFLYETNSCIALIEMIIYNPKISKSTRQVALDECIKCVIMEAKGRGYTHLIGFTDIGAVVERAKKHGFVKDKNKHTLVTKDLTWDS